VRHRRLRATGEGGGRSLREGPIKLRRIRKRVPTRRIVRSEPRRMAVPGSILRQNCPPRALDGRRTRGYDSPLRLTGAIASGGRHLNLDEACERAPSSEPTNGRGEFCPPALALKRPLRQSSRPAERVSRTTTCRESRGVGSSPAGVYVHIVSLGSPCLNG
jgi:hypothetical protein